LARSASELPGIRTWTPLKNFRNLALVCPMNWKNLSWATQRSQRWNNRRRIEGDFSADEEHSGHQSRIVRIAAHNCRDIGARIAGSRQSIIAAPSGK
jgi:hypothetical protein